MTEFILASTSIYRRALLERLGIPFRSVAPGVDEETAVPWDCDPAQRVRQLAIAKAQAVAVEHPEAFVLGSDQVALHRGHTFGKPGSHEHAIEQLTFLSGGEHQLVTAVALSHRGNISTEMDVATLRMRALSNEEIREYVQAENPIDCAGSYKLESLGISLFHSINSNDPTGMIGLPLIVVCRLLRNAGFPLL